MRIKLQCLMFGALFALLPISMAQVVMPGTIPTSLDSKMVFDAAGPEQRKSLTNVYLIACPNPDGASYTFGTGFVIDRGVVVTNAHVTATCDETSLVGLDAKGGRISFSKAIKDQNRDLALLVPTNKLTGGLTLAPTENLLPGTTVSTWGFPFAFNGTSPLLSVGYIAGYRLLPHDPPDQSGIKHIVVNGAFNHGNSGGPLLVAQHNEVVGIVVATAQLYPPAVKNLIDKLSSQKEGIIWSWTQPDGQQQNISESAVTGFLLGQFYEKTQVVIGEAIAVSELKAMIAEKKDLLPTQQSPVKAEGARSK